MLLEDLMSELNGYLAIMSEIIVRNRGFIDSIIGDEIFAIFGISKDHHADDACNAAIEYLKALGIHNKRQGNKVFFDIGMGINSWNVVLENIGSKYKLKFTVMGDNVYLAARMEGSTLQYKCNVMLTENTKKLLTQEHDMKELGSIPVKGFEGEIRVYSLQE